MIFFKYIEFWVLRSFNPTHFRLNDGFLISLVAHFFSSLIMILILITLNSLLLRSLVLAVSIWFIAYWFISIFIYLVKKAKYSTFTRMIQRFWKRALWLFWLIELFLFCIYLFLAIISPQEVSYMLDTTQLVNNMSENYIIFFGNTLLALIIILLLNIWLLAHKYNTLVDLISAIVVLLLVRAVYEDFIQFMAINNLYTNTNWVRARVELSSNLIDSGSIGGVWEQEINELKMRTIVHYTYLLVFLKLWHTIFIVGFFMFFENMRLLVQEVSYNILAANLQNCYFLFFFNYILKFYTLKVYFNYCGSFVYFWFLTTSNVYDFSHIYYLVVPQYFWAIIL